MDIKQIYKNCKKNLVIYMHIRYNNNHKFKQGGPMMIYKAYKLRLYPTIEQTILISKNIGTSRFIYNYFLDKKENYYKETKTNLSLKTMKHMLVELKQEEKYKWFCEVDSMSLTNTLENLDTAYTNYFKYEKNKPVFKKREVHESYTTNCIRSTYKDNNYSNILIDFENKTIKLPKLGLVNFKGYRNKTNFNGRIISATISKEVNKYYVSLTVEEEIEKINVSTSLDAVGLDVGVKSLVVTSTGEEYSKLDNSRIEKHIEDLQRKLSIKVKGSNNYKKLKTKIGRLYMKLRNRRKFYIHEITNKITKENNVIVTENLKVKEMITNGTRKLRKGIINASLRELERQLEYKSKWRDKTLIKINTYYPSSQVCSSCGYQNKLMKDLNIREWTCPKCNHEHERDINASINILFQGLLKLNGLKEVKI